VPPPIHTISDLDLAILEDTGVPVTSHVACFTRGTRVLTPAGYVLIETLRAGDAVVTHGGSVQPVVWTGHRTIDCRRHPDPARVYPICITAHAFGENLPERPLRVSPNHALYFDGLLISARLLVDGVLVRSEPCSIVEYYHLELASHDIILAEGLPSESYLDCGDFANGGGGGQPVSGFHRLSARGCVGGAWLCASLPVRRAHHRRPRFAALQQ
jgi:hypothetical protein